ncbi:MAG: hypothetical protein LBD29_05225 [Treponema sp.]|jgi:hypothetical protein|nr:hypothetical protein [Treponema sp.]
MVKYIVIVSIAFLFFGALEAQEYADIPIPSEFPQRIKLLYRLDFDSDFFFIAQNAGPLIWEAYPGPFPQQDAWYHTLQSILGANDKIAQTIPSEADADLFTQAVSQGIPVFIHIYISGDANAGIIQIRYTFRGVFSESFTFENTFETKVPEENDLLSHFWLPLNTDLDIFLNQVIRPPLRIHGPTGTLVYGFSKEPLVIPDTEYIFIDVPLPGTYAWRMVHKRYVNRKGIFMADQDHLVLTLPRDSFSFSDFLRIFDGNNQRK